MKKVFLVYPFIEVFLLGFSYYFFIKWEQPLNNGGDHATIAVSSIFLHIVNIIIAYISFSKHTNKYPQNNLSEHLFNPKTSQLGHQGNGNYVIEIEEVDKGVWRTKDGQEEMQFDLKGYICPKRYICTYFIRNIHYAVINKNKYPLIKLFKSLNLYPFSKYQNVVISFSSCGKIYKKKIVEGNKTKVTWLMRLILRSKYYIDFMFRLSVGEMRKEHIKMTEEKYRNGGHH